MALPRTLRSTLTHSAAALGVLATIAIAGCAATGPAPAPSPWDGAPTDGTWDGGDVSFGAITPIREVAAGPRDEYTFQISAAPTLTTDDNGESVLVTTTLAVVRVHDQGSGDDLSGSESLIFIPGERSQPMNEAYGTRPDVVCEDEQLEVGGSTTCTLAFEAVPSEVQDSYWQINGLAVGTWPSQIVPGG